MKLFRLPRTAEDFWRGIYSTKTKTLGSAQKGAAWKWWVYQDPVPPAPKLDGVGHTITRGLRGKVGGAFPAYLLKYRNLVVQTNTRQTSHEAIGRDGFSTVMRMNVDWGIENTWYERPPPATSMLGNIGSGGTGSYHIRTFAAADGYASPPIQVKLKTKGIQAPIRIKATRGFEVSLDGLSFYPSVAISQRPKEELIPTGVLNTRFYMRKSGGILWGIDIFPNGFGGVVAMPKFIKGQVVLETFPLKVALKVALIGDPNFKHALFIGDANDAGNMIRAPKIADKMADESNPFRDGGQGFNAGLRYGGGVEAFEGFF